MALCVACRACAVACTMAETGLRASERAWRRLSNNSDKHFQQQSRKKLSEFLPADE